MLSNLRRALAASTAVLVTMLVLAVMNLQAQSEGVIVRTHGADYSGFPQVCVLAAPLTTNGRLIADLQQDAFAIYENGASREISGLSKEYIGTQVAIVFDASGSFRQPGVLGPQRTRFDEAIDAIDELILTENWIRRDLRRDQFLLIAPTGSTTFEVAQAWTVETNAVHNAAYQLAYDNLDTPLYRMLVEAMARMKDVPDWEARPRFVVVLSDGVDRTSVQDVTDVIHRANALDVAILAIKIGPDGTGAATVLQRLAQETGGAFASYRGAESLTELFDRVKSQTEQYRACYRSAISQSGRQTLQVGLKRGEDAEFRSATFDITVPVQPGLVEISEPENGTVIDRIADRWDIAPEAIEPRALPVTVRLTWPDGFSRGLELLRFEVNGRIVASLAPDQGFAWDISGLESGEHSLRVIVRDELGIESPSEPVTIRVNVVIPPRPEESVIAGSVPRGANHTIMLLLEGATAGPQVQADAGGAFVFEGLRAGVYFVQDLDRRINSGRTIGPITLDGENSAEVEFTPVTIIVIVREMEPWAWFLLALGVVAVALALYAIVKKPPIVQDMTTTIVGAVRDATEVFRPRRGARRAANGYLIPIVDDIGTRGDPIELRSQSVSVGRDPARAQIIFSDRSVSRLHARIVEEADGVFMLYDEGSSSGTYLNEERVEHQPRKINAGDEIEFGRVRVVFQPRQEEDVTEPFQSRA